MSVMRVEMIVNKAKIYFLGTMFLPLMDTAHVTAFI